MKQDATQSRRRVRAKRITKLAVRKGRAHPVMVDATALLRRLRAKRREFIHVYGPHGWGWKDGLDTAIDFVREATK